MGPLFVRMFRWKRGNVPGRTMLGLHRVYVPTRRPYLRRGSLSVSNKTQERLYQGRDIQTGDAVVQCSS